MPCAPPSHSTIDHRPWNSGHSEKAKRPFLEKHSNQVVGVTRSGNLKGSGVVQRRNGSRCDLVAHAIPGPKQVAIARRADRPADEMETLSSESPRQVVDSARVALRRLPPAQEATDFVAAHLRSSLRSELSPWPPDTRNVLLRIGMWNGPDSHIVHLAVIQLLDTAPWFVIASFVGSAALAIAAGRPSADGNQTGLATRVVGVFYALAVTVVTALWVREHF